MLIQLRMGPIPFAGAGVSGCRLIFDGIFVRFVNGVAGARSSRT